MVLGFALIVFGVLVLTTRFGQVDSKVVEVFVSFGLNPSRSPMIQVWAFTPWAGWDAWTRLDVTSTPPHNAFYTWEGVTEVRREGREWRVDVGPFTAHYYGR